MSYAPLNMKDIAIIDAFPIYDVDPIILNVGCGPGRIDFHLMEMGYKVYAFDYKTYETWKNIETNKGFVKFFKADLFDKESLPVKETPIVICSEVLEHLVEYKKALKRILELTKVRLIITIPFERSFDVLTPPPAGHSNYWSNKRKRGKFKDVHEFHDLCYPYSVSISKIITKPKDIDLKQNAYLIIIDKTQYSGFR